MARPSQIDRLPDEIKELIGKLRRQGRHIKEIRAALKELDIDIPKSSLARHTKELDELGEILKTSQVAAQALIDRLDNKGNPTARLNAQMAHTLLFKLQEAHLRDGGAKLDGKEVMFLTSALRSVTAADKQTHDLEINLRKEWDAEQKKKLEALKGDVAAGRMTLDLDALERVFGVAYGAM